ncbi:MAG: PilZ domain-containing protein [Deltaproteobacteria bacterium]|nr:PilZ domain-containing protein [Deltaproteobacteria bacterium]OEU44538.1 MAG: hypothetical protein BBJ60_11785 [Desulfobacterales bacterium S7086C20]
MRTTVQRSEGNSAASKLIDLIQNMSGADQEALLDMLQGWQCHHRRKDSRKSCSIPVDYATGECSFKGFIKNMSAGGVFIETRRPVSVGQDISMTFIPSNLGKQINVKGEIFWANVVGIGVKFTTENQTLIAMLEGL